MTLRQFDVDAYDTLEIFRLDYSLCSGKEPVLLPQMGRNKTGLVRAV